MLLYSSLSKTSPIVPGGFLQLADRRTFLTESRFDLRAVRIRRYLSSAALRRY
jgi:hypothetical protein